MIDNSENAPNIPELRRKEKFWALNKNKSNKDKKKIPKMLYGFRRLWERISFKLVGGNRKKMIGHAHNFFFLIDYTAVKDSSFI